MSKLTDRERLWTSLALHRNSVPAGILSELNITAGGSESRENLRHTVTLQRRLIESLRAEAAAAAERATMRERSRCFEVCARYPDNLMAKHLAAEIRKGAR